ncbi:MAG TPA: carbohydrate kinase family protein [Candidatus Saccharimonadia bacterium]|nr:carbohydrate kinase family protein [Candidatus Saccharimonadia bacterium]
MRAVVTGSISFDYIMDFKGRYADRIMPDKIHQISLSLLVDKLSKHFGGTAGNIAYSLKLLGVDPNIVSVAGDDFAPYKEFFRKNDISTDNIKIIPKLATSSYFAITDIDNNQIGSFYLGATKKADTTSLRSVPAASLVILSPTEPAAMGKYVRESKSRKLTYLFDPAFQTGAMSVAQLRDGVTHAHIFIGNDYEIALAEKKLGWTHAQLLKNVPILITTLGAKGSVIEQKTERIVIRPCKLRKVLDPTGAGDAYRSGFVAGYLRGFDLLTCGQMGSLAATYVVEQYGTVNHHYTKKQFSDRFYLNYKRRLAL